MEDGVFHAPAVAGELKKRFVEARLHTDRPDEVSQRLSKMMRAKVGTISMPVYVIVDPKTEQELKRRLGAMLSEEKFAQWLNVSQP